MPRDVQITPTPFAVHCPRHGKVYLSQAEYDQQMTRAHELWKCPGCGREAVWDDNNYEARIDLWAEGDNRHE